MVTKKNLVLLAGIGLVASGAVTAFLIYQDLDSQSQLNSGSSGQFKMEEIHANPALVMHIHAQIQVVKDGILQKLPAEIGIAKELWHDHSLDEFGPSKGIIAPVHTHDDSGTVHIESVVARNYTLGEFLSIWGLGRDDIAAVSPVGGPEIADYQSHVLAANERLVIELKA